MLKRRAFLCVIVIAVAAVSAVHADAARAASSNGKPFAEANVQAPHVSWARALGTYRLVLGFSLAHPLLWEQPFEILGIQDGPDGVDPLGIKGGVKGLTPKPDQDPDYQVELDPDPSLH